MNTHFTLIIRTWIKLVQIPPQNNCAPLPIIGMSTDQHCIAIRPMNMAERERGEGRCSASQTISGKGGDAGENHLMAFVKAAVKRESEKRARFCAKRNRLLISTYQTISYDVYWLRRVLKMTTQMEQSKPIYLHTNGHKIWNLCRVHCGRRMCTTSCYLSSHW